MASFAAAARWPGRLIVFFPSPAAPRLAAVRYVLALPRSAVRIFSFSPFGLCREERERERARAAPTPLRPESAREAAASVRWRPFLFFFPARGGLHRDARECEARRQCAPRLQHRTVAYWGRRSHTTGGGGVRFRPLALKCRRSFRLACCSRSLGWFRCGPSSGTRVRVFETAASAPPFSLARAPSVLGLSEGVRVRAPAKLARTIVIGSGGDY